MKSTKLKQVRAQTPQTPTTLRVNNLIHQQNFFYDYEFPLIAPKYQMNTTASSRLKFYKNKNQQSPYTEPRSQSQKRDRSYSTTPKVNNMSQSSTITTSPSSSDKNELPFSFRIAIENYNQSNTLYNSKQFHTSLKQRRKQAPKQDYINDSFEIKQYEQKERIRKLKENIKDKDKYLFEISVLNYTKHINQNNSLYQSSITKYLK